MFILGLGCCTHVLILTCTCPVFTLQLTSLSCDSCKLLLRCYKVLMHVSCTGGLLLSSLQVLLQMTSLVYFCYQLLLQLLELGRQGNVTVVDLLRCMIVHLLKLADSTSLPNLVSLQLLHHLS